MSLLLISPRRLIVTQNIHNAAFNNHNKLFLTFHLLSTLSFTSRFSNRLTLSTGIVSLHWHIVQFSFSIQVVTTACCFVSFVLLFRSLPFNCIGKHNNAGLYCSQNTVLITFQKRRIAADIYSYRQSTHTENLVDHFNLWSKNRRQNQNYQILSNLIALIKCCHRTLF